ncbi:MAG: molybdopterin-dependent oxidoreductase, partial [Clostridia bacterium]|nr:molybdopterin-dependent oxidoreductase [Clostridia bacterium]
MEKGDHQIFRNTCPGNCYSACSILSHVKKGKLLKVEGDPNHGYTLGRLCAQGYALTRKDYHRDRLPFPMLQSPRGSGRWSRISWDEALSIIAEKILSLNRSFNNNQSLGLIRGAGNKGFMQKIAEDFFESLGARILSERTGSDARLGTGRLEMPEPENMAKAKHIVIWGVNPAVNGVHQMFFINRARDFSAKLIVIDPVFTPTAAQGDIYIQVKPGTDRLLAMAVAKLLVEEGNIDEDFLLQNTEGWPEYKHYVTEQVSLEEAGRLTGVGTKAIRELARYYS